MTNIDARAKRSRRALLDAAIELLLKNPQASLSDIANHAGVGRATLYRQFESREQLIQELALESLVITDKVVEPIKQRQLSAKLTLTEMLKVLMPLADRYHFILSIWSIAEQDDEVMEIYNSQLNKLAALIERAKQEGSVRSSLDTAWIVCLFDSVIFSGWWMMGNMGMTAEVAAKHAIESIFNGIS